MKISGQVEQIFAHAVALDQSNHLKNSIYADGKEIFIMNFDHSVILRFRLRDTEKLFNNPISFKANDYDSNTFYEEDGKIVFLSQEKGYERKKVCGKAEHEPKDVKTMFNKFLKQEIESEKLIINDSVLSLLDSDLSHIEFSGGKGNTIKMTQRNIYSGGVIEVTEATKGMFKNNLKKDFAPVGIKTKDFEALFSFQNSLKFEFPVGKKQDFVIVRSVDKNKRDMTGLIACCIYDEIIKVKQIKS